MKKLITFSLSFMALAISVSSCKKTSESPNMKPKILEYEQGPGDDPHNCGGCNPVSNQDSTGKN